jgi:Protein of unknown function (DUF2786)
MGKANRERRRRAEKARRQQTAGSAFRRDDDVPVWFRPASGPTPEELVGAAVGDALRALDRNDERAAAMVLAPWRGDEHRARLQRALAGMIVPLVTAIWQGGWQPADVVRVALRRRGAAHSALLSRAIGVELSGYATTTIDSRWLAQLDELGIRRARGDGGRWLAAGNDAGEPSWSLALQVAVEVIHLLGSLPRLEPISALPGAAAPAARHTGPVPDERILGRVRALLAKAESTPYPAEAETFTAGAQALMARHSIDAALLAADAGGRHEPVAVRIGIDNPYEAPKASLLDVVARANRCRAVWSSELGFCTVVGFETDLRAVETVFTSLLVQATRAMTGAGSRTDAAGRSRTRSFRQSFLFSYALRIGERLEEATTAQTHEASQAAGGDRLLPVLAARQQDVDDTVDRLFSQLTYKRTTWGRDAEGWRSGRAAADLAVMGPQGRLPA